MTWQSGGNSQNLFLCNKQSNWPFITKFDLLQQSKFDLLQLWKRDLLYDSDKAWTSTTLKTWPSVWLKQSKHDLLQHWKNDLLYESNSQSMTFYTLKTWPSVWLSQSLTFYHLKNWPSLCLKQSKLELQQEYNAHNLTLWMTQSKCDRLQHSEFNLPQQSNLDRLEVCENLTFYNIQNLTSSNSRNWTSWVLSTKVKTWPSVLFRMIMINKS